MNPPAVTIHSATARAIRRSMSRHEFSEPGGRLVDKVLFYSHERERYRAIFPRDGFLARLTRLTASKVSVELKALRACRVIDWELVLREASGRRLEYTAYWILPPDQWRLLWRGQRRDEYGNVNGPGAEYWETAELREIENWLEMLDSDQPEFWSPPASLDALLKEDFAERCVRSAGDGKVENRRASESAAAENGSPGGNHELSPITRARVSPPETFVETKTTGIPPGGPVTSQVTSYLPGKSAAPAVTCQETVPSTRDSVLEGTRKLEDSGTRLIGSKCTNSQSSSTRRAREAVTCQETSQHTAEYRAYVSERLWSTIGLHERNGRAGWLWERALQQIPDVLDSLISEVRQLEAAGRLRTNKGAWLNHHTWGALQVR